MSQPIDDHIKRIDARQDDFETRLKEVESGQTEPIKPINMYELLLQTNTKLDTIIQTQNDRGGKLETLKHDLDEHSKTWLKTVQENYDEHKEDLKGIEKRLDAIADVQRLILERLPKPPES